MKKAIDALRFCMGFADFEESEVLYTTDDMYPSSRAPKGFFEGMILVALISCASVATFLCTASGKQLLDQLTNLQDQTPSGIIADIAFCSIAIGSTAGIIFGMLMGQVNVWVYEKRTRKSARVEDNPVLSRKFFHQPA